MGKNSAEAPGQKKEAPHEILEAPHEIHCPCEGAKKEQRTKVRCSYLF